MHFVGNAMGSVPDLNQNQKSQLDYLCKYFARTLDSIINSEKTEKINEHTYLRTFLPKFPEDSFQRLTLLFSLTRENKDGYNISNFNFDINH